MNYSILDFIYLIGSLGLFLYGMKIMSEGLQKIAGDRMRSVLSAMTSNRFLGALTGLLVTALVQSSSATTLMVVSFVNAGLLQLTQAISVIMGANIGTTVTAWIISLLGFKVDISSFSIPLLALAIPLIFSKRPKWNSYGEFIMGFSLLFLGLQFLKDSMPDLQSNPEALAFLQKYTELGFLSVLIFLFIGTILTIIVQSSSATVAITLIMCSQGWIPFEMATAMILGENIGTTITANLAALSANNAAKRAAFSHFLFNVFGVIWVLALFYPLVDFVSEIIVRGDGADPRDLFPAIADLHNVYDKGDVQLITGGGAVHNQEMALIQKNVNNMAGSVSVGLALFHTLFNLANTFVMIWFVPILARICNAVIKPSKQHSMSKEFSHLQFLSTRMLSTSELSLLQVNKEIVSYASKTRAMLGMVKEMYETQTPEEFDRVYDRIEKYEGICDRVEVEIAQYLGELSTGDLSGDSRKAVSAYQRISSEIESMGDSCYNLARIRKRMQDDGVEYTPLLQSQLKEMHEFLEIVLDNTIYICEETDRNKDMLYEAEDLETQLNNKYKRLTAKNLKDLDAQLYPYLLSVYYLDMLDEYENLGDYAINIVEEFIKE